MNPIDKLGAAWKKFWQKGKRGKLFILSIIATAVFVLSGWELLATWETEPVVDYQIPLVERMDNYAWISFGIGGIIMIAGWLYFHDHNKNFKRFNELIETASKANFVRNIDEIEDLAIQLGPDFEKQVIEKRKEFNVKTR